MSEKAEDHYKERLREMMAAYGDQILRLCFLYLGDSDMAGDAAQETFLSAYQALPRFKGKSSEYTWLTRIAVNACRQLRRKPWFRMVDRGVDITTLPLAGEEKEPVDDTVLTEVMSLPEKYRQVILLYYYQGLDTKEVAAVLRIPAATVSTRLKRAKEQLRPRLERWYFDE